MSAPVPDATPPRFAPGETVRVVDRQVLGHCRTPFYLRGQLGTIVEVAGKHRDPEKLAYHKPGLPARYLYRVRFAQTALWCNAAEAGEDMLIADIYEYWLDPAAREGDA